MNASNLKTISAKGAAVRCGRPSKERAGEVDTRILDAARKVFLERGFDGASIDEIAQLARAGKPTIYSRFRDKRALFSAVVTMHILSRIAVFKPELPAGPTIEKRLARSAETAMRWFLDGERIALMRLAIAEARRFPDLASSASRMARSLSTEIGIRLLGELAQSAEFRALPAFAPERLETTARFFLDVVVLPLLLRALFEVNLKTLDSEIEPHVTRSVAFFLAACRQGVS